MGRANSVSRKAKERNVAIILQLPGHRLSVSPLATATWTGGRRVEQPKIGIT